MVKCLICNFESNASSLRNHLRQKHNLSESDYLDLYPNAQINNTISLEICPICNKEFKYLKLHMNKKHGIKENYVDTSDNDEYVTCAICGDRKKCLSVHLKYKHNMSCEEYREIYNLSTNSKSYSESQSKASKSGNRLKIIIDRNKSDKQIEIVSKRNSDPDFIRKCKDGIAKSNTWHNAHSIGATKRNLRLWKDPEYCKKMSEILPSKYGKKHKYFSEVFNKEFSLKSTSELNFVRLCEENKDNWNIIDIKYEEFPIIYNKDDIKHSYYPDFFIYCNNKLSYIVEVKWDDGPSDITNNILKSFSAVKYCEENNLIYCWFKSRYNLQIKQLEDISLMPK